MTRAWSCGVRRLPATIEGDPPESTVAVLWTCDGFVVGASVFTGTSVIDSQLRESFEQTLAEPLHGAPVGRPAQVFVDSDSLARRLRALLPEVAVDVRETPDVDAAFDSLAESMSDARLDPMEAFMEMEEAVREELMPSALGLFACLPWEIVPADVPIRVRIPAYGAADARLSVMGHNGESYGVMLFLSEEDLELFATCAEGMLDPTELTLPKCYSLNYAPIDPALVGVDAEVDPFPLPVLTVFDGNMQRSPSQSEAKLILAAVGGLARFLETRSEELVVPSSWAAGISGRYKISVLGTKVEVRLTAKIGRSG